MKKGTVIIFLLINISSLNSQNLVSNGDFESYINCPNNSYSTTIILATPWQNPNSGTADYFNGCAAYNSGFNVPGGLGGFYQIAHSGIGYAGFYSIQHPFNDAREYIQGAISDSLIIGKCYSVTFYANLMNKLKIGANNLGAYISQTAVTSSGYNVLNYNPQIILQGNPPIVDTINWTKISDLYQAVGGEKYITIGNFNYDSTTVEQIVDSTSSYNAAYYYIDDVSIYEIKTSDAGRDTTVCTGDSVQLGTNNYEGVTYSWQPTTGLSNANIGNPMASPSIATTYYLTQTTPCATTVDSVMVTVGNCTVGINEYKNENSNFKLYPNPSNGNFTLEYHLESNQSGSLTIYDVTGKQISSKNLNSSNTNVLIDATHLDAGVYYYEIKISGFKTKADKLIIMK